MSESPEQAPPEAFLWNELHPAEQIPERPLQDVCESVSLPLDATFAFVLVLPERIKLQIFEHAAQGVMCELDALPEPIPEPVTMQLADAAPEEACTQQPCSPGVGIIQEQAGILIGRVYRDPSGFLYTVVTAAIPVEDAEASIAQVKLRASSWPPIWQELLKDQELQIIGWYHSHPGYGIFLSATDRQTQNTYFAAPWQLALVVDPIREEFGAFAGITPESLDPAAVISI